MYTKINASRMEVFDNRSLRLTPARVKARTGCTHIINGWVFGSGLRLCDDITVAGKVLSKSRYNDWCLCCDLDGHPAMTTGDAHWKTSAVPLLKDGKKLVRKLTPDVARPAERTAVGWLDGG